MLTLALISLALATQPDAAAAPPPSAPPPDRAAPQQLDAPAQARALCEALVPVERLSGSGGVVRQARAKAEHEARREAAVDGRYRVVIAADRLKFADYDPDDQVLTLSDRALLVAAGGSLRVFSADEPGLPVTADPAAAERIVQAAARKALSLAITFTLPDDDATCAHANGTARYALGVEPISWEYVTGGEVLARGSEDGDRPTVSAEQGARPRVEVADPLEGGGRGVRTAIEARSSELESCYRRALQRQPALDGSLVAEFQVLDGGDPTIRMAADSVLDDDMTSCVRGVLSKVTLPPGEDVRAAIPIHFVLEQPAGTEGTGAAP